MKAYVLLFVSRLAKRKKNTTSSVAVRAGMVRCAARFSPKTVSVAAAIHVGKGGFSKRSSPFIVGTNQLPSVAISWAVTKLRHSMMSGCKAVILAKNTAQQSASSKANLLKSWNFWQKYVFFLLGQREISIYLVRHINPKIRHYFSWLLNILIVSSFGISSGKSGMKSKMWHQVARHALHAVAAAEVDT